MRVIALEKGARGVVKIGLDSGSLFLFRQVYLSPEAGQDVSAGDPASEAAGILSVLSEAYASGRELDGPEWAVMLERIERARVLFAIEKSALSILARREHSRAELQIKLTKKELPAADSRIVLDRLEAEGLLSDERFAQAWLRSRLRSHPEGEIRLKAGLRVKGVAKAIVTDQVGGEREEVLKGLEKVSRKIWQSEQRRMERRESGIENQAEVMKRCYAKLRSRGFVHADVKKALGKISGKTPDIDEGDEST